MGTKIFIIVMALIYIFFFLSVFGPMKSRKKFWIAVYKIRAGMDFFSYWFFNLCGMAAVLCAIWKLANDFL